MSPDNLEKDFYDNDDDLDSFEYIAQSLQVFSGSTDDDDDDDDTQALIVKTLLKLPYDVSEKTINEVFNNMKTNRNICTY